MPLVGEKLNLLITMSIFPNLSFFRYHADPSAFIIENIITFNNL